MTDQTLPAPYAARLKTLRGQLQDSTIDAMLVTRPENRRYLSGYSARDGQIDETSGFLLITKESQYLFTDFRYMIQARKEAKGFEVVIYGSGPIATLAETVSKAGVGRLGFEEDFLTYRFYRQLNEKTKGANLVPSSGVVEQQRRTKDQAEVRRITNALRITEASLRETLVWLRPGVTEREAALYLDAKMREHGGFGPAFDTIMASGPNGALPHAEPGNRKIREGETIVIDCGTELDGYRSDMTRTIVLGQPKAWIKEIYTLVRQAQLAGIAAIKPGVMSGDVDQAARSVIEEGGFGPHFGHALGHGVGLATHEAPSLSNARSVKLEPGMVVTVEPGIYLEGKGGVRLEEMVLVTEKGARVLNKDDTFYQWED